MHTVFVIQRNYTSSAHQVLSTWRDEEMGNPFPPTAVAQNLSRRRTEIEMQNNQNQQNNQNKNSQNNNQNQNKNQQNNQNSQNKNQQNNK